MLPQKCWCLRCININLCSSCRPVISSETLCKREGVECVCLHLAAPAFAPHAHNRARLSSCSSRGGVSLVLSEFLVRQASSTRRIDTRLSPKTTAPALYLNIKHGVSPPANVYRVPRTHRASFLCVDDSFLQATTHISHSRPRDGLGGRDYGELFANFSINRGRVEFYKQQQFHFSSDTRHDAMHAVPWFSSCSFAPVGLLSRYFDVRF